MWSILILNKARIVCLRIGLSNISKSFVKGQLTLGFPRRLSKDTLSGAYQNSLLYPCFLASTQTLAGILNLKECYLHTAMAVNERVWMDDRRDPGRGFCLQSGRFMAADTDHMPAGVRCSPHAGGQAGPLAWGYCGLKEDALWICASVLSQLQFIQCLKGREARGNRSARFSLAFLQMFPLPLQSLNLSMAHYQPSKYLLVCPD